MSSAILSIDTTKMIEGLKHASEHFDRVLVASCLAKAERRFQRAHWNMRRGCRRKRKAAIRELWLALVNEVFWRARSMHPTATVRRRNDKATIEIVQASGRRAFVKFDGFKIRVREYGPPID